MLPPSCLSQTRGRHFIITRRLAVRRSEVHAPESTPTIFIRQCSFISVFRTRACSMAQMTQWASLTGSHSIPKNYLLTLTYVHVWAGARAHSEHLCAGHFVNICISGTAYLGGLVFVLLCYDIKWVWEKHTGPVFWRHILTYLWLQHELAEFSFKLAVL